MEELILERIKKNLTFLQLKRIAEIIENESKRAMEEKISYSEYLDRLLEEEIACKKERRAHLLLKIAGFPYLKTIDDFDFSFQPSLDETKVKELFSLSFVKRAENVIFLGPPGVGKTHLAISLGIKACASGMRCYFSTMDNLVKKLLSEEVSKEKRDRFLSFFKPSLLIVDEVGYLPLKREETNLFFTLVARRYERGSIIITSNKSFSEWGEVFSDSTLATAILDRLLHHVTVINISGNSFRLKDRIAEAEMDKEGGGGKEIFTNHG